MIELAENKIYKSIQNNKWFKIFEDAINEAIDKACSEGKFECYFLLNKVVENLEIKKDTPLFPPTVHEGIYQNTKDERNSLYACIYFTYRKQGYKVSIYEQGFIYSLHISWGDYE